MSDPTDRPTVWLVNLFFGRGTAPTGMLLESLARELDRRGAEVHVLTSRAGYHRSSERRHAATEPRPTAGRVHRLFTFPRRADGRWSRLCCWLTFSLSAGLFVFTRRMPQLAIVMTTPPTLPGIFVLRKKLARRPGRLILWNQDTYPDVLDAVGLLRRESLLYRLFDRWQRWSARRIDHAIALDGAMAALLLGQGAPRVDVVPNWEAESEASWDDNRRGRQLPRKLEQLLAEVATAFRYIVLYTGNYGWGHDLAAMKQYVRDNPAQRDFYFLLVGGGEKWPELEALSADRIGCVATHGYLPKSQMPALIDRCDFGLVCLQQDCAGLMSPSKMHGYLLRGKPLIYLGPAESNVDETLRAVPCGWRVDPADAPGLAELLKSLTAADFDYQRWSQAALLAAHSRHREQIGVANLMRVVRLK